jgi:hypothetical protein
MRLFVTKKSKEQKDEKLKIKTTTRRIIAVGTVISLLCLIISAVVSNPSAYLDATTVDYIKSYSLDTATTTRTDTHSTDISTDTVDCMLERGLNGKWIHDWGYANRTNYKIGPTYTTWHLPEQKFQATPEQPFRFATGWKWEDEKCPVHEATMENFCLMASRLNLTRILVMGDSKGIQFGVSLTSLLGQPPPSLFFNRISRPFRIPCTIFDSSNQDDEKINDNRNISKTNATKSFDLTMLIYRRSPPSDWVYIQQEADSEGKKANKERNFVLNNHDHRTAIIANMGGWMKSKNDYTSSFHAFLNWIDSFPGTIKKNLLVFYRPTISGHEDCLPMGNMDYNNITQTDSYNWSTPIYQQPHQNYEAYLSIVASNSTFGRFNMDKYKWNDIIKYNTYAKQILENRTALSLLSLSLPSSSWDDVGKANKTSITPIHWLNIFNSSILRRDGHVGFDDCSHWAHPGPSDWWVHFFYSHLLDLANTNI